jgi:hypothetical protein
VAKIRLDQPGLDLIPSPGFDNLRARERPSRIHQRLTQQGLKVLAVANADFGTMQEGYGGPRNSPHSLVVRSGELWNTASLRPTLALLEDGRAEIRNFMTELSLEPVEGGPAIPLERFNHWQPLQRAALFGPQWEVTEERPANMTEVRFTLQGRISPSGAVEATVVDVFDSRGGVPIGVNEVVAQFPRASEDARRFAAGQSWRLISRTLPRADIRQAISGGPTIVREGKKDIPFEQEGIADTFVEARHPRTAYGLDRDGKTLILVVVDGRQPGWSVGVNLHELAEVMVNEGAWTSMNMDGGGSSTLIVDGVIKNRPSDATGERTTTSSLAVVLRPRSPGM